MTEASNPVRALETSVSILEALKELDGAGVTELSNRLGMTKGAVHNHLSTLAERGFVVQEGDEYNVGLRFFEFGEYIRTSHKIFELAKPEIDNIVDDTGELGNLLVEEHGRGIYLYRAEGENALSLDTGAGARVHLHNTALGKAILAFLPNQRVEVIIDRHGMPATTENTITDFDDLQEELSEIQERGVAFDREERALGVKCVAAPVRTNTGRILGAISVAGPESRMHGNYYESELPEMVRDAASVVGINATYSD